MSNILERRVFVLNKVWQVINVITVQDALSQMAADAATGMVVVAEEDNFYPVTWEEWLKLPILSEDEVIHTAKLKVRMPTVIVAVNYAKVPKRRPKFTLKNVARTYGYHCAYSNRLLKPDEWSKDHVVPLSRGGQDVPENVVLAAKDINNRKGSKTPEEAGLPRPTIRKLAVAPFEPTHPHHKLFLQ